MRKIIDYQIVSAYSYQDLSERVVAQIKNNWEPFESVYVQIDPKLGNIYQPMVKYQDG